MIYASRYVKHRHYDERNFLHAINISPVRLSASIIGKLYQDQHYNNALYLSRIQPAFIWKYISTPILLERRHGDHTDGSF